MHDRIIAKNRLFAISDWIITHQAILLLALITGLGIFLRFYTLGSESIWFDEAASIYSAKHPLILMLMECVGGHRHPPLHFFILKIWIMLFGDSEVSVRSISAIFGVASIPLIFIIGKQLFSSRVGLIASFLLSVSVFAIYFSQEARSYAMLLFFTLLSFYLFIKIIVHRDTGKVYFFAYFIANTLLVYTHYFGLFVVASQLSYFILTRRCLKINGRLFWYAQAATGIVFLPWAVVFVVFSIPRSFSWGQPSLHDLLSTLASYSGYGDTNRYWILLGYGFLCILGILSWRIIKRRRPEEKLTNTSSLSKSNLSFNLTLLLLTVWLAFPIMFPFLISQLPLEVTGIYVTRYTISAFPAFLILVANGLGKLLSRKILYPLFVVILTGICLFSVTTLQNYYSQTGKEQWREVVNLIETSLQPDDVIVLNEWYFLKAIEYYSKTNLKTQEIESGFEEQEINQFKADDKQRMWLVQVEWGSESTRNYLEKVSDEHSLILIRKFVGIDVYLFDLNYLTTKTIQD
jgi:mannosyltransferase